MDLEFYRLEEKDLPFFLEVRNCVSEKLHDSRQFTLQEAIEWLPKSKTQYWIISCKNVNVGYFRLLKLTDLSWQIGADIHPKFQNKGIASNAYPLFINEIVRRLDPPPTLLELRVLKNNENAFSLYRKLGFTIEGKTEFDLKMTLELK